MDEEDQAEVANLIADLIVTQNELYAVVHELGIEDSDTTPEEAVMELKAEIARLRAELAKAHAMHDEQDRVERRSARLEMTFRDVRAYIYQSLGAASVLLLFWWMFGSAVCR